MDKWNWHYSSSMGSSCSLEVLKLYSDNQHQSSIYCNLHVHSSLHKFLLIQRWWSTCRGWKAEHFKKICAFVSICCSTHEEEAKKGGMSLQVDSEFGIYLLSMVELIVIISFKPQYVHDPRIQPDHHCTWKKNNDFPRQGISSLHPTGWPDRHT